MNCVKETELTESVQTRLQARLSETVITGKCQVWIMAAEKDNILSGFLLYI